jgi:hypothetical protein
VQEFTPLAKVVDGQASWNSALEFTVSLPVGAGGAGYGNASKASLPDTIIYLYYGNAGMCLFIRYLIGRCICFCYNACAGLQARRMW